MWQIDGETMETVTDFIFLGYKINSKTLVPWKNSYDKLSILKSRHLTLWTKVHLVKDMAFPVVMYRCEGWTIKKAEGQTIDAFEL